MVKLSFMVCMRNAWVKVLKMDSRLVTQIFLNILNSNISLNVYNNPCYHSNETHCILLYDGHVIFISQSIIRPRPPELNANI